MAENDVSQILVGGHRIGIIGLKPVLEGVARELAGRPDEEIKAELMKRLGKSNYIAPAAEAAYAAAFFREYKKSIGEPVPVEHSGALQIKVLGPGCPSWRSPATGSWAARRWSSTARWSRSGACRRNPS